MISDALHPYQREGLEFLVGKKRAILADPIGQGKTVQAIAAAIEQDAKRILVVCPSSVRMTWRDEITKWTDWKYQIVEGNPIKRKEIILNPCQVTIIHYDILRMHVSALESVKWDVIICDEAHRLKNRNTKMAKAMTKISHANKACHVYLLTGTPVMNRGEELWSLLHVLNRERFSSYWKWVNEHFHVIQKDFGNGFPVKLIGSVKRPTEFKEYMSSYLIRREPSKQNEIEIIHKVIRVPLAPAEKKAYLTMYAQMYAEIRDDLEITVDNALAKLIRLKQIAISKALLDPTATVISGAKVETIVEFLEDYEGKVLIFSQFATAINRLHKLLHYQFGSAAFTGETPFVKRLEAIQEWKGNEKCQCLLTTIRAGGVGIDGLQHHANVVIFLDKDWNPAMNAQATGRLARKGQELPVTEVSIIADKTVEDRIERLLAYKIRQAKDTVPRITLEDLKDIMDESPNGIFI